MSACVVWGAGLLIYAFTTVSNPTHPTCHLITPHLTGTWPYFDQVDKGLAFEPTAVHRSPNEELLIAGDSAGAVKVYNYPCLTKDAKPTRHKGHIKEVAKVRFSCDGKHAVSLGKHDRAIMVWRILVDDVRANMQFT